MIEKCFIYIFIPKFRYRESCLLLMVSISVYIDNHVLVMIWGFLQLTKNQNYVSCEIAFFLPAYILKARDIFPLTLLHSELPNGVLAVLRAVGLNMGTNFFFALF